MARTVNDEKLDTRAARLRAPARPKPYWKTLLPGQLHLGYRRRKGKGGTVPGTWLARLYLGGERYRIVPLGLADDVDGAGLTYAEAVELAHKSHKSGPNASQPTTVKEAIADYVAWLKTHRASGADAERRAQTMILPELGDIKLTNLTAKRIVAWRDRIAETPARMRTGKGAPQNYHPTPSTPEAVRARRATCNRTLTILKGALNMAFREGAVEDDRAWRRVKPFEKVHAARPGHLSEEEALRLVNAADPDSGFRDLVSAALLTGCRYGELIGLRVRDFQRGKLHIAHSKSGKPRDVTLTPEAAAFFSSITIGRAGSGFILLRSGRQWGKSEQTRWMKEACVGANIIPPIGFHQTRHTWASISVANGMPLPVVARNLGHASTAMVEKHYGHLTDNYIDTVIREHAPSYGITRPTNVRPIRK